MRKADLEHIIRAASAITNQYEIIVVGSQSILGSVDAPPQECLVSVEAISLFQAMKNCPI